MSFQGFRNIYPAFLPKIPHDNPDQIKQMSINDGLIDFHVPNTQNLTIEMAPNNASDAAVNRFLWAVDPELVPYALESSDFGRSLQSGVIKHTNLTGGGYAHCGGELWFVNDSRIIINGCSGRYGPSTGAQLRDAALAFKAYGYEVGSMGFNEELNEFTDFVVGEDDLEWF